MPLPLILLGISGASALYGAKKGYDGFGDFQQAAALQREAEETQARARDRFANTREDLRYTLEELGRLKLFLQEKQLGRFTALFAQVRAVEGTVNMAADSLDSVGAYELGKMRDLSVQAGEILAGSAGSLGTAALAGIAAYGGVAAFGTASTGTAIGTLSGIAASNATWACLGGGSLVAGGGGIAGGMAVVGGFVAGPAIAVGGMLTAAKAQSTLADARVNLATANEDAAKLDQQNSELKVIRTEAKEFTGLLSRFSTQMTIALDRLETVIATRGTDYHTYSEAERRTVHAAVQFARILKRLLEAPLVTPDGKVSEEYQAASKAAAPFAAQN